MGRIKRGGYVFLARKGDHDPKHVHVYQDAKKIVKWDLENQQVMEGKISRRIRDLIDDLIREGKL